MSWRRVLLCLLAAALLVGTWGAHWLVAKPGGARWSLGALERLVPGLEIRWQAGTWAGGLQLEYLRFHAAAIELTMQQVQLRWTPAALARGELRIQRLAAERVRLQLRDDGSPPADTLPTVAFPLTLVVEDLLVPAFELVTAGGTRLEAAIGTTLRWQDTGLRVSSTTLVYQQLVLRGEAALELQGDYALEGAVQVVGEPLPAELELEAGGSLEALDFSARLAGQFPLLAQGNARLLSTDVPLQVELANTAAWLLAAGEEQVALETLQLQLAGTTASFTGALAAQLQEARFGNSELTADFGWQEGQLELNPLQWHGGDSGRADARCTVDTPRGQWQCRGNLGPLDLAALVPAIQGQLHSPFEVAGSWAEGESSLALSFENLGGQLNGAPISGALSLSSRDFASWDVEPSQLRVGDNRLGFAGQVGEVLDLDLALVATDLAQLLPGARGHLSADMVISGAPATPDLVGSMEGVALGWEQIALEGLAAEFSVAQLGEEASHLRLDGSGLAASGQALGQLVLRIDGNRHRQALAADLSGAELAQARVACDGLARGTRWHLDCETLEGSLLLEGQQRPWSLDRPLQLALDGDPQQLDVAPLCLRMAPASLCLEQGFHWQEQVLQPTQLYLAGLPLAWWSGWLPEPLRLEEGGTLHGELAVDSLQPPLARGYLAVDGLALAWTRGEQPQRLEVATLRADLALEASRAELRLDGDSSSLGELQLALTVDDPQGQQQLAGSARLDALQLASLDGLLPEVEQLAGRVDGQLEFGGTLAAPRVDGVIQLADGLYQQLGLPYPVEAIGATVRLREQQAEFDAAFVINEGRGSSQGTVNWQAGETPWQARGELVLDAISVGFLEDSFANVSSQLDFAAEPGEIEVGGRIRVNEADIHLLALPPDSIGPSPDAEIIGRAEQQAQWRVKANVAVELGDDLRFRGFGADLKLAGALQIRNSKRELVQVLGEVRVDSGVYRAYGQRLKIRRGSLLFDGPIDNPDLQLEAIRESRNRDLVGGLRVSGTLQEPVGELFSEPPMSETDIAHFLLTGRVRSSSERFGQGSAEGTLLSLGLAGANEPAAELARRFGINDFQISAENSEAGTETRVSGYLAPNLLVSYGTLLKDRSNTVTVQYFVTPNFIIEAVSGFSSALDFIYNFYIE